LNNRLFNSSNPFQKDFKKVLCVCSAGILRSPTIANVLYKEFEYNTRACGAIKDYALIPYDLVLGAWADEIVIAEDWIKDYIEPEFHSKIISLNIPDTYPYMDPVLQEMILKTYKDNRPTQNES